MGTELLHYVDLGPHLEMRSSHEDLMRTSQMRN